MKHRIRKLFSLTLALSMLLSMIPLGTSAEIVDEFEGLETLEEIPFEFELEPGDLPYELLREAVLAAEDIPYCISPALAEERGHVNRLYLQEPDDYTVMFQNRDGSKTVYVFSHPVKGMTVTTTASIQVNGSVVSFAGSNAITSRIAELHDYNIGHSEIAYIPNGVLSSDGIDLTEDARGWARGESTAAALSYNISSEVAAEYAASVTLPDADASLTAVTPGVTITPNDPAPLGGMTVMSISYSDLAGLMSFKNVSTNQFLTLSTSSTSLTANASIVVPRSRWYVQYDTELGYLISNYSDVYNTYLGFDDTDEFIIDSLNNMMDTFTVSIESTANSIVTIDCDQIAISSTGALYEKSEDDDYFPTSCEWQIVSKYDVTLITSIGTPTPRVEQKGVGFYLDYTVYPADATDYSIGLYYASTGQSVEHDTESYEDDEYEYFINSTGTYTVYYKDNVTGIQSQNFTLTVVDHIIIPESDVRIEQKNVGFTLDYTFYPGASTYNNVNLYYADTNTVVPHTGDTYTISTAGVYTVYYKDSYSGVESEDFLLLVYNSIKTYDERNTYSIRSYNLSSESKSLYLTVNSSEGLGLSPKDLNSMDIDRGAGPVSINCERLDTISRTFTFKNTADLGEVFPGSYITATMSTSQYTDLPNKRAVLAATTDTCSQNHMLTNKNNIANTIYKTSNNSLNLMAFTPNATQFTVLDMETYYLFVDTATFIGTPTVIMALKADLSTETVSMVEINALTNDLDLFKWHIDFVGVDAPLMKQTSKYWCGPTSFLQVLLGNGVTVDGDMYQTSINEQQSAVEETLSMGSSGVSTAGFVGNMNRNDNKRLLPDEYVAHETIINSSIDVTTLKSSIVNSLQNQMACMFITSSGYAPYKYEYDYDNHTAHIICIIGYDTVTETLLIANCHYWDSDDSKYNVFGIYEISFEDFLLDAGRIWYFTKT